jgi:hypothetical protein
MKEGEIGGACGTYGGEKISRVWSENPKGKRPLGRRNSRSEDTI